MYDLDRIQKIITSIEGYLKNLKEIKILSLSDLDDSKNFLAASMLVFSIVNRTIDLGEEVVAANNFGTPSTYRDIFFLLHKNKFIEEDMFKEISYLVADKRRFAISKLWVECFSTKPFISCYISRRVRAIARKSASASYFAILYI